MSDHYSEYNPDSQPAEVGAEAGKTEEQVAEIEERSVEVRIHGRYLVRAGDARRTLLGFHGYGESAEVHLNQLERIPGAGEWTLVAVEALHPFYRLKTNEVVASWMTKLNREEAIRENVAYVKSVVADLGGSGTVVVTGFSQGASMAWRAAAAIRCHGVIALGGDVPPDVTAQNSVQFGRVLAGRGTRDEWYTEEKLNNDLRFLEQTAHAVTVCRFEGGHEWTDEFRMAASLFLASFTA